MAKPAQVRVTLTPELEAFIEERIAAGRFGTAGEVVREGLRLLEAREHVREAALAEIQREIEVGVTQAKAGRLSDGGPFFEGLRDKARSTR